MHFLMKYYWLLSADCCCCCCCRRLRDLSLLNKLREKFNEVEMEDWFSGKKMKRSYMFWKVLKLFFVFRLFWQCVLFLRANHDSIYAVCVCSFTGATVNWTWIRLIALYSFNRKYSTCLSHAPESASERPRDLKDVVLSRSFAHARTDK